MPTFKFDGHYDDHINVTGSNSIWILSRNASISATDSGNDGFVEEDTRHDNRIIVNGTVTCDFYGVAANGTNTSIVVGKHGSIASDFGVVLYGVDQELVNHGKIIGDINGVNLSRSNNSIINSGLISGAQNGIEVRPSINPVTTNEKQGSIYGGEVGIYIESEAGDKTTTYNHGRIEGGTSFAYRGGDGNDRLTNDGTLDGGIYMGAGEDRVDARGSKSGYAVYGSYGNDILTTNRADVSLMEFSGEGTGYDTVRSTVSYTTRINVDALQLLGKSNINGTGAADENTIEGNAGNNVLRGMGGFDQLLGYQGNDRLIGGTEGDTFFFSTGSDHDVVVDFEVGIDRFVLRDWKAVKDFNDMVSHHAQEHGNDVIIKAADDWLTIKNISKDELDTASFLFS